MNSLGADILEPMGYIPMARGMNGQEVASVTWSHPSTGIAVVVHSNGQAELRAVYKLIHLSTGLISWPHPRFEMFERQIMQLLASVDWTVRG